MAVLGTERILRVQRVFASVWENAIAHLRVPEVTPKIRVTPNLTACRAIFFSSCGSFLELPSSAPKSNCPRETEASTRELVISE